MRSKLEETSSIPVITERSQLYAMPVKSHVKLDAVNRSVDVSLNRTEKFFDNDDGEI